MALQIWLPLISDLRNQGLANSTSFGTTTAFATSGKIGSKSLYSNAQKTVTFTELANITNFSFAYWIKIDSSIAITSWADIIGLECIAGSSTTIIRDEFTSTVGCHQILMGKDSTVGSNTNTYYGTGAIATGAKDVWTHYVVVKNNVNTYVYTNGVLTNTLTNTNFEKSPQKLTGKIYLGNTSSTAAQVNDFRIYDHCLSPMEVKELSKGLILHYPLNRQGWGQENLLLNSNVEKSGKNTIITYDLSTEGITAVKGATMRISADIKSDVANATIDCYVRSSTSNSMCSNTIFTGIGTTYQRYTMTTVCNTNQDKTPQWFAFRCNGSNGTTTTATFTIKNVKLELGEIATPWCPNSSDALATTMGLNGTTEYDTSGYCNNGTWHGTHTNTSDTPKYAVSTTATGSASTYLEGPILPAEAQTAALWIKCKKSQNAAIFNDKTTGLQIGLLNSILYMNSKTSTAGFTTTHWKDDDWNHVVVTYDGTTRKAYINGEAETQSGASNYYIHNADNCWLWNRSYNNNYPFNGSLSDFRIYATALSPTDVKSLYQNCATIDPDGTIRGQIRS